MRKLLFSLALLPLLNGLSFAAFSQQSYKTTVHFDFNKYTLSPEEAHALDSFLITLPNIPEAFRFRVTGYTDNAGTASYNQRLSVKRATAVVAFMKAKGYQEKVTQSGKGGELPIATNATEEGRQMNRRTEVEVDLCLPDLKGITGVSNETETNTMDADRGATLVTKSGTRLMIPSAAFKYGNGDIVKGRVNVGFAEYRDPLDFLLSGIPMHLHTDDELMPFNSGGMFKIDATQNNQQLYLRQGKNIDVRFNYNNSIPDLNFYFFDSVTNSWRLIRSLQQPQNSGGGEGGGGSVTPGICMADSVFEQGYLVNAGLRYAYANEPQLKHFATKKPLVQHLKECEAKRYHFARLVDSLSCRYNLTIEEKSRLGKERFALSPKEGYGRKHRFLRYVYFYKNLPKALMDSLEATSIDDYLLEQKNGSWNLTLIDYRGKKLVLDNVKIKVDDEDSTVKKGAKAIQDFAATNLKNRQLRNTYADSVTSYAKHAKEDTVKLWKIPWLSKDSLSCFQTLNKPYMSDEEQQLSLDEWLTYFDNHRDRMRLRFDSLRMKEEFLQAESVFLERQRQSRAMWDNYGRAKSDTIVDAAAGIITSKDLGLEGLSVSELGIYNCDQLQRLENPVPLYVQYKTPEGKKIKPVVALLMDSKLNGLLRFDGSYGVGPYRIAYSPTSVTRMLVVTSDRKTFLVTPEVFAGINPSRQKDETYTLIASPIKKVENKAELKKELKM